MSRIPPFFMLGGPEAQEVLTYEYHDRSPPDTAQEQEAEFGPLRWIVPKSEPTYLSRQASLGDPLRRNSSRLQSSLRTHTSILPLLPIRRSRSVSPKVQIRDYFSLRSQSTTVPLPIIRRTRTDEAVSPSLRDRDSVLPSPSAGVCRIEYAQVAP